MLWNPYHKQTRSYKILQDPPRCYKILRDTRQKCFGIHINSKQDNKRFYGILDKNAFESISIANKILQDPARFDKILQDPTRLYGILDKNAMELISIVNKTLQDSTGY